MCMRKPQPPPNGDRWRLVEMVARQHLRLRVITPAPAGHHAATEQQPITAAGPLPASDSLHTQDRFSFLNPTLLLTATARINLLLTFRKNKQDSFHSDSFRRWFFLKLVLWLWRAGKHPELFYSQCQDSDREMT